MNKKTWRIIGRFALLLLIQLLVLNHVFLGGYTFPMLYLLAILMLPTNMKRIPLLLIAFGTGLLVDVMNNMLGFHALACTVVAMMRILFADRILTRGEPTAIDRPSIYSVSPQYFISYMLILVASFDLIFADPPYDKFDIKQILPLVKLLNREGVLVVSSPIPLEIPGLSLLKSRKYASCIISLFVL